jgi:hypothetical protein
MKNKNNREKRLGLLNFEGDAVWAKKAEDDEFVIYDQWDGIMEILSKQDFLRFLDGEIELVDGEGKKWNYMREHVDSKPSHRSLYNFIID